MSVDIDTLAATVREGLYPWPDWVAAWDCLVEHARTLEREREKAREESADARASAEAARAMRDRHEERYEKHKHKARADRYEKAVAEIAEAGCENVTGDMRECIETKRDRSNWCWPCIARAMSLTDEQLEGVRADARAALAGEDVPGSDHGVFSPGNEAGIDPAHTDEQTVRDARDALQRLGDNAIFMSEARKWYEAVAALDRLEAERGEAREPLTLRDGLDLADRAESAEAEIVRLRAALEEIVKQIPMAEGRNILVADSYDGTANPVILHIANAALAGEDA